MHILVISISLIFLSFYPQCTQQQIIKSPMYVPIHSLRKSDICSILNIALAPTIDKYWI